MSAYENVVGEEHIDPNQESGRWYYCKVGNHASCHSREPAYAYNEARCRCACHPLLFTVVDEVGEISPQVWDILKGGTP